MSLKCVAFEQMKCSSVVYLNREEIRSIVFQDSIFKHNFDVDPEYRYLS